MPRYNTIIFDLDGTLFKTDTVFLESLGQVCSARKITMRDEGYITGLIGRPMVEICREIFGEHISENEIERIRDEIRDIESRVITTSGMLYDGVAGMLDRLCSDGYTLCICSNGSGRYVETVLSAFNIQKRFKIIKSRIEGVSKAQLIRQILDETGSRNAVVVGDTHFDFEAADETGCLSVGVLYGYGRNDCEQADFIVSSPSDVYCAITKINGVYSKILDQLAGRKTGTEPLIVGINGIDTSGKTILTNELGAYLCMAGFIVQVIHLDDFHNPSSVRMQGDDPVAGYFSNAFNLDSLARDVLEPVSTAGCLDIELTLLDLGTDRYDNKKRYIVDRDTIVLIEGVLLYREPIDQYFDYRIYIDITFDEAIKRALVRDSVIFGGSVEERYRSKYFPVQKLYIEKYGPKEKSDMVIDNEDYRNPKIVKCYPDG